MSDEYKAKLLLSDGIIDQEEFDLIRMGIIDLDNLLEERGY
jgi:hypothetical protein